MVAPVFQLIARLAFLAVRHVSQPVSARIRNGASRNDIIRNYFCLPAAQFYHWLETTLKLYVLGLGKPQKVPPLNEKMAVELGAQLLGETIVFSAAASIALWELNKSAARTKTKEAHLMNRLNLMEQNLSETTKTVEKQMAQNRQLQHKLAKLSSEMNKFLGKNDDRKALPNSGSSSSRDSVRRTIKLNTDIFHVTSQGQRVTLEPSKLCKNGYCTVSLSCDSDFSSVKGEGFLLAASQDVLNCLFGLNRK